MSEYKSLHQGEKLRLLSKKKGFSQLDFAKRMGVSRQTVVNYFNLYDLKPYVIEKACEILEVDTSEFTGEYKVEDKEEVYGLKRDNDHLRGLLKVLEEKVSLLENTLKDKDEIIRILKEKNTG